MLGFSFWLYGTVLGMEFMVRVCLSLSYLFWYVIFSINWCVGVTRFWISLRKKKKLLCVKVYSIFSVTIGRRKSEAFYVTILVLIHSLSFLFVYCITCDPPLPYFSLPFGSLVYIKDYVHYFCKTVKSFWDLESKILSKIKGMERLDESKSNSS